MNNIRDEAYLKAFGKNLRLIRKRQGFSMEKLALDAGIEYSQIFDIEHGKINTTISTVRVIAKALKIPEKDLFDFNA
ncbi:helix-turn-helix domain-containing protein [Sinomicrobium kalidii]|uniref:helix-turn-helix domain-containing protein n=1 Tax=Sinomicrobium kalidii TaxID=2900738 RepID=UPI001E5E6389|nr:helix-turn-helix transcriptional regulator [Sinomicrobium kalidii]UGU17718.1 helix-turn-helix domain-containing protein [Sinomicrobium kalidii]